VYVIKSRKFIKVGFDMDKINAVSNYYNSDVMIEWNRLKDHPIEFEINKRYIKKYLKSSDNVLDIGGGPGRYSFYMAQMGCNVTLLDLAQEHINFANEQAKEMNINLSTVCGDARYVDKIIKDKFDVILLMGPLYHLTNEQDRIKTVEATLNLLKPNGILFTHFISSYAAVWDFLVSKPENILNENMAKYYDVFANNKSFSGSSFTESHFSRPQEVEPFMAQFPLEKLHILSSQSFLALKEKELMEQPQEVFNAWVDLAEKVCEREEFLSLAHHFLYIGKKV
jgi:2-polyprenyl-3-methyl-5-hydroxy-6-metoxy-1,4-benzoquinol methylase